MLWVQGAVRGAWLCLGYSRCLCLCLHILRLESHEAWRRGAWPLDRYFFLSRCSQQPLASISAFCSCLAQGVAEGRQTVGDAVLFITLMQQLYAPLNYFGSYCAPWPSVSLRPVLALSGCVSWVVGRCAPLHSLIWSCTSRKYCATYQHSSLLLSWSGGSLSSKPFI